MPVHLSIASVLFPSLRGRFAYFPAAPPHAALGSRRCWQSAKAGQFEIRETRDRVKESPFSDQRMTRTRPLCPRCPLDPTRLLPTRLPLPLPQSIGQQQWSRWSWTWAYIPIGGGIAAGGCFQRHGAIPEWRPPAATWSSFDTNTAWSSVSGRDGWK